MGYISVSIAMTVNINLTWDLNQNYNVQEGSIVQIVAYRTGNGSNPTGDADDNFTICSNVHLLLGHAGSYSNKYIGNIKELAANIREILSHKTVVHRAPNIKLIKISIFRKIYNKIVDFLK